MPITQADIDEQTRQLLEAVQARTDKTAEGSATVRTLQEQFNAAADDVETATLKGPVGPNGGGITYNGRNVISTEALKVQQTEQKIAESRTLEALTAAGVNPDVNADQVTKRLADLNQFATLAVQKQKDVIANVNSKFLDDPVQYIVNQFKLDGQIREADQAAKGMKTQAEAIKLLNEEATGAAAMAQTAKKTVTDASITADLDAAAASSVARAAQHRQATIGQNLDFVKTQDHLSLSQIQNLAAGVEASVKSGNFALQREQFALHKKQVAQAMDIALKDSEDREENRAIQRTTVEMVQKGLEGMGFKGAEQLFPPAKIMAMLQSKVPLALAGLQNGFSMAATGNTQYGEAPADAVRTVVTTRAPGLPEQHLMIQGVQAAYAKAKNLTLKEQTDLGVEIKTPEGVFTAAGKILQKKVEDWTAAIDPMDNSNPFRIKSLATIISHPKLAENEFINKVVRKNVDLGGTTPDFNQLFRLGNAAIKAKEVSAESVDVALASIAAIGVNNNNKFTQFVGFGIKPQTSYNVNLQMGPGVFGTVQEIHDVKNVTEVTRVRMLMEARAKGIIAPNQEEIYGR